MMVASQRRPCCTKSQRQKGDWANRLQIYFAAFICICWPQQMMSHVSTHPQASSTDTTSPQTSQEYLSFGLTFLLPVVAERLREGKVKGRYSNRCAMEL